ncbi:hypothetical protein [Ensifer adhaerens]|uniref:hypothetical protein n=1 Tax=Ensifer adhaerens TaxID=106592 RepID=UPI003F83D01C
MPDLELDQSTAVDPVSYNIRQHIGGLAGMTGYHFQDVVSAVILLEIAAFDPSDNPFLEQEVKDAFNDDLHVTWDNHQRRFQIKHVEDLSWVKELRDQFRSEADKHPDAYLNLIVHDERIHKTMKESRHHHKLGYVNVGYVDACWAREPFSNSRICAALDQLSMVPLHDATYVNRWHVVFGTWVNTSGRKGFLFDVVNAMELASDYTIRRMCEPTDEMNHLVWKLGEEIPDLKFAADGFKLVMSNHAGLTFIPLSVEWAKIDNEFWTNFPRNPWEFMTRIGAFKSDIRRP